MNSIATTNTSRMRMTAQRKPSSIKPITVSPPKTQFSMQDLLRERQNQIEQLMIERDLDRHEAHNQGLLFQKRIDELEEKVKKLERSLSKERKRNDDLQTSVDEATFCGDELDAQSQVYREKIQDLERQIQALTATSDGGDNLIAINAATEAANEEIHALRNKLEKQTQAHQAKVIEMREAEKRFRTEIEDLQKQVEESTENRNTIQKCLEDELKAVKIALSERETELQRRNGELNALNDQLIKLNAELSVQRAESATLDEMLKAQQLDGSESRKLLEDRLTENNKLKGEISEQKKLNETIESKLKELNDEKQKSNENQQLLEQKLEESLGKMGTKEISLQELEEKIIEITKKYETAIAENSILVTDKQNLQETNAALKNSEDKAKASIADLQGALNNANANLKIIEESRVVLEARVKSLEDLEKTKTEETEILRAQIITFEEKTRSLQSESSSAIQDTGNKIDQLNSQVKALMESLAQREEHLKSQQIETAGQKAMVMEKTKELQSTTEALENMDKLNEQMQLELELVGSRSKELDLSLKQSEEKCTQQASVIDDMSRKIETLQSKCDALTAQNETLEKELHSNRSTGNELQAEVQRLHEELATKQKLFTDSEGQSNENRLKLESQISELQQKLSNITKDYGEQKQQTQHAKAEVEQRKDQITILEEKLVKQELVSSDAARQQQNMQTKIEALAAQNDELQKDLTTLRTTSTDSNAELLKLAQDVSAKQKAYEDLLDKSNNERATLEGELQMRQQQIDSLCSQVESLTQELKKTSEESFKRFEELKETSEKVSKLELESGDLTRQLEAHTIKIKSLQDENEKLQKDLTTQRTASKDSNVELTKLTEEAAGKQKTLQALIDESQAVRLSHEKKLHEQSQQLQANSDEIEKLRSELEKINAENTAQSIEFEILKGSLQKDTQQQLESLKEAESTERTKLLAQLERQTEAATAAKNAHDEAIDELQKEIEMKDHELQKIQSEAQTNQTEYLKTIEELQTEKAKLNTKIDQFQADYTNASKKLQEEKQALQQNIESLTNALKQKEEALQLLQGEAMQAKMAEANSSSDLSHLQSEIISLQQTLETIKSDAEHKAKLAEADKRRLEELESLLEAFKKSNAQITETNSRLSKSLQMAESEKNEISQIFELFEMESDQTSTELLDKLALMKQELELAQSKASSMDAALQSSREKSAAALQEAQNALASLQSNSSENVAKLSEMQQERDRAIQNGKTMEQEYRNVQNTLARYKSEKEREITELRRRIDDLKAVSNVVGNVNTGVAGNSSVPSDFPSFPDVNGEKTSQIDFLHSIIADMQHKNDTLKAKIQALEAIPVDYTQPNAFEFLTKRKPAPRVFCDICDEFDKHETEDCPLQASDDRGVSPPPTMSDEKRERKIPPPRKYCESCEVFGHEVGECDAEESY